jgi:plastocyanin
MRKAVPIIAAAAVAAGVAALPSVAATTTKTVAVKDDFFGPKKLTITKGSKVKWVWKGKQAHNVSVANGPTIFRFGTRKTGTKTHTFTKRGTYSIVCTIHAPDMHMTIKVK